MMMLLYWLCCVAAKNYYYEYGTYLTVRPKVQGKKSDTILCQRTTPYEYEYEYGYSKERKQSEQTEQSQIFYKAPTVH